jgi:hypothetical protein
MLSLMMTIILRLLRIPDDRPVLPLCRWNDGHRGLAVFIGRAGGFTIHATGSWDDIGVTLLEMHLIDVRDEFGSIQVPG